MMLQQYRGIQLSLLGAILLCLLAGVYLLAEKRFSKRAPSRIVKHSLDTPADEALKYWTANKMRDAKPAEMPNVDAPGQRKERSPRPPRPPRSHHA